MRIEIHLPHLHRRRRSRFFFLRRLYNRLFSTARRNRQKAILRDFEEELVDRTHRSFINHIRQKIIMRSAAVFFAMLLIGSLSPNFFSFEGSSFEYSQAQASYEDDYAQNVLLSIDGYLTKTYAPTEESKGASGVFTVKVEAGDTLSTIAQRYGVTVRDVIVNNSLSERSVLSPGQKLLIANGIMHKVSKSDTLDSIAKAYGVEKDRILATNQITEKDLKAGISLIIAGAKRVQMPSSPSGKNSRGNIANYQVPSQFGKLLFPTIGKYTQFYHPGHYAIDIGNTQSPDVVAAENGVVEKSQCGWNGGYGCVIIVNHGDGMKTLYGHMRKLYVTIGEQIVRGQSVGQMGNTGNVHGPTGIHLHFEVIINGVKRNPLAFF